QRRDDGDVGQRGRLHGDVVLGEEALLLRHHDRQRVRGVVECDADGGVASAGPRGPGGAGGGGAGTRAAAGQGDEPRGRDGGNAKEAGGTHVGSTEIGDTGH